MTLKEECFDLYFLNNNFYYIRFDSDDNIIDCSDKYILSIYKKYYYLKLTIVMMFILNL